ncbi:MAG: hypothetical protein IIC97_09820 [Chloroflexi bacterium]|nr:hypothetical protein [Chloroflexota bacterium]
MLRAHRFGTSRIGTSNFLKIGVAIYLTVTVIAVAWGILYTVDGKNLKAITEERVEQRETISTLKQQLSGVELEAVSLESRLESLTLLISVLE